MKGFPAYPDHKRVFVELANNGRKPMAMGHMVRTKTNYYCVTQTGRAYGIALADEKLDDPMLQVYFDINQFIDHPMIGQWLDDPSFPHTYAEAIRFFRVDSGRLWGVDLMRMREVALARAIGYCSANELQYFVRRGRSPIPVGALSAAQNFLEVIRRRFSEFRMDARATAP
jgi:hypothetical protein